MIKAKASQYYEKLPTKEELDGLRAALKEKGNALVAELQAEVAAELKSGVAQYKAEGLSVADTLERLKRVVAVVDKLVVAPIKGYVAADTDAADVSDTTSVTPPEAELSIKAITSESVSASLVIKGFEPKEKSDCRPLPPTGAGAVSESEEEEVYEDPVEGSP